MDNPRFYEALVGEDELGVVVRAHIHIEAGVNALLDQLVPYPDHLPSLEYKRRVLLACALGLKESLLLPLQELGNIRNLFGHQIDTKLTAGMVDKFYESFSGEDCGALLAAHNVTFPQAPFPNLSPKERFIVLTLDLKLLLDVALEQLIAARHPIAEIR